MRRSLFLAVSMLALAGAAHAQDRVQVGVLECRGGASIGFVVGSVTNLGCVLRVQGFPEDRYIATIRKVGLDLGITQETALAWAVYAPVNRLGPGDLAGEYAGAQGSASAATPSPASERRSSSRPPGPRARSTSVGSWLSA